MSNLTELLKSFDSLVHRCTLVTRCLKKLRIVQFVLCSLSLFLSFIQGKQVS